MAIGLAAGAFLGFCTVAYGAAMKVMVGGSLLNNAIFAAAIGVTIQAICFGAYLFIKRRSEFIASFTEWRRAGMAGIWASICSICWFAAFLNHEVAPVRAEEFCTAKGEPEFVLILLDPPRQGAAEQSAQLVELADLLYEKAPNNVPGIVPDIVMVSCNPHTAVRDIAVLVAAGWQLEEVQMIDQFVRTAHTEIVTRLVFDGRQNTRR